MPVIVGSFLTRYWKPLIALVVSLGLLATFAVQRHTIGSLRATIVTLEQQVGTLTGRITDDAAKLTQRDALIKTQNQAVIAMATQSVADEQAYKQRLAAAEKKTAGLQAQVAQVQAFKASHPEDAAVTQAELLTMIRSTIADYQKEKAQ